ELLAAQFVEDAADVGDAGAEGDIVTVRREDIQILQVDLQNAALQYPQRVHRFDAGADPVAGVRAGTDAWVAPFDERERVLRVPEAILRVVRTFWVIVDRHPDVVLLDQLLDEIHCRRVWLGGDRADAQLARELERLPVVRLVRAKPGDAEGNRSDIE